MVNFAENQQRWDRGEVSLEDCRRKGAEHAAYGWVKTGMGFKASDEQLAAYNRGFDEYKENT